MPDGGTWDTTTGKPFETIGDGLMVDDDALTYDPEVVSSVEYVDANITDTMNFIIQERDAEHAGRVAGDNLLHNEVERVEAKVDEKMSLVDGTKPFVDWNGAVGTNPTITITNGDDTFTLCRVNPKIITDIIPDADGKTIQNFSYVEVVNGEEQEHTGSGWITGTDIYGGGNHIIGGHTTGTNIVLLSGAAGTYNITLGSSTVPFTIPARGTYVVYTDSDNYLKTIIISGSTDSKIEQNGEDITEATADVLSDYLATQGQISDVQTEISNLKNIGRFCAIWNASTGLPTSEPTITPYEYKVGDYFRIGVAGYRVPTGSTYVQGAYDTVAEETDIGDVWYYDGTQWVKQASSGGGTVQDVQINGVSILDGGIANIPKASTTSFGVSKVGENYGTKIVSSFMSIAKAEDNDIEAKTSIYRPIVPSNLNKAVMEGLGNNSLTWSAAYKTSARTTIGAGEPVEIEVW